MKSKIVMVPVNITKDFTSIVLASKKPGGEKLTFMAFPTVLEDKVWAAIVETIRPFTQEMIKYAKEKRKQNRPKR